MVLICISENEKENDSRGGQATQAIIQRRRRPKRRSTGVCNVGAEVINTLINIYELCSRKIKKTH